MTDDVLQGLAALIHSRRGESASKSYTRELLDAGPQRCAKKLGEEATETVIAALGRGPDAPSRARPPTSSIICSCCSRAGTCPSSDVSGGARVAHRHIRSRRESGPDKTSP